MFFTIGIILGFVLGWYVNEKFEDIAAGIKLLKFWKQNKMFGSLKIAMVAILITGIGAAGMYVMKLRSDNAILKVNQIKLESAVADQKQLIENQKKDFEEILKSNQEMNKLIGALKKDLDDLDKRFNKKNRDFGKLAIEKTKVIERIMNKGSVNAQRCIEIASGAELTEKEKNATKKSEINPECPSIANPAYIPYNNQICVVY